MTGLPHTHFLREAYKFGEPLSPIVQSVGIEMQKLIPKEHIEENRHLIIEGSEGIMEPLNEKQFYADFLKQLGAPVLLVVKNCPGAIHQALMTLEKLHQKKIPLFGIVLNGQKDTLVRRSIEEYCKPPRMFEMGNIAHITENALKKAFTETFMEECA
jgi:dethiobiotin synthetase/malonyl-CoA O-methyltransferase